MRRTQLLTHTDLDGVGCAVLVLGTVENALPPLLVENGSIDDRVRAVLRERLQRAADHRVLITDHGIREETAALVEEFLAAGGEVVLLDHHRTSEHLASRPWATVDESHSATALLFHFLGSPEPYREFARVVEDHDLWRHQDERSAPLASLLGLIGHQRFLGRFGASPDLSFTEAEQLVLELEDQRRENYLSRKVEQAVLRDLRGVTWAICYAEAYQSDLAERLMTRLGARATAIVNVSKRTVSLRARSLDVAAIAERQGGGGHARAAAFTFRESPAEPDFERFEEALQDLLG